MIPGSFALDVVVVVIVWMLVMLVGGGLLWCLVILELELLWLVVLWLSVSAAELVWQLAML